MDMSPRARCQAASCNKQSTTRPHTAGRKINTRPQATGDIQQGGNTGSERRGQRTQHSALSTQHRTPRKGHEGSLHGSASPEYTSKRDLKGAVGGEQCGNVLSSLRSDIIIVQACGTKTDPCAYNQRGSRSGTQGGMRTRGG